MNNYFNFEFIPYEEGYGTDIDAIRNNTVLNKYNYNIVQEDEIKGTFSLIEMNMHDLRLSINFEAKDKQAAEDLINEIKFQCLLGNLEGTDKDSYTIFFDADYDTIKIMELCELAPNDLLYNKLPNDKR